MDVNSTIQVKPYTTSLYDSVKLLWASQGYPVIPEVLLPLIGAVAFDLNHQPVAAVWLVKGSDIPLGMLAWTVGSKAADRETRHKGIQAVTEHVLQRGRALGIKYVKGVVQNRSLLADYQAVGAELADENICQVGWRL